MGGMEMIRKNLANAITGLGFVFCFVFLWLNYSHRTTVWLAIGLSLAVYATDYFDGKFARWLGIVSDFGKLADPLRDKFFEANIFYYLLANTQVESALKLIIIPIIFVEIGLIIIRVWARANGVVLAANEFGKTKMFAICLTSPLCVLDAEYAKHLGNLDIAATFLLFEMFGFSLLYAFWSFWGQLKSYRAQKSAPVQTARD